MVSRFYFSDVAQQVVGGFLLSGPFVVTEEVWRLVENMTVFHSLLIVTITVIIGYGASYEADVDRDLEKETDVAGMPVRLISLILVSYLSVTSLTLLLNAPVTFEATTIVTLKVISIASIFSLIGAAMVDSVL